MKIFHAFVTVWHTRGNQYNVSSYTFYAVCSGEKEAKQMIAKEVRTFRYWKHNTDLEEIKGDKKKLRELSWQGLTDKIYNEAVMRQLKVNRKEHKKLQRRMENSDYHSATHIPIENCFKDPNYFYTVLKNLTSASKVFVADGKIHIYEVGKKRCERLFEGELEKEKRELLEEAKKEVEEAFRGILEKLNVLGT